MNKPELGVGLDCPFCKKPLSEPEKVEWLRVKHPTKAYYTCPCGARLKEVHYQGTRKVYLRS